jgi:hypothetical protein
MTLATLNTLINTSAQNLSQFKGLSAAYGVLLGGAPSIDGYTFLINENNTTNFGAGGTTVFNDENIYINTINALYKGNTTAKSTFDAIISSAATIQDALTLVYNYVIPASLRTTAGLDYFKSQATYFATRAAEIDNSGLNGTALVGFASLIKIAVDSDIGGLGDTINDLRAAVGNGTAALPQGGDVLTALETADGTQFDPDDVVSVPNQGQTFTLTTSVDITSNTTGNDTYAGIFGSATGNTYAPGDVVDGGAGTADVLNLTATGATASGIVTVKNVEIINITDTVGASIDGTLIENAPAINFLSTIDAQTSAVTSAALGSTYGLRGQGDLTVTYAGVTGTADTAKLSVTGVGSSTNAVALNVSSSNAIEAVTLASTGTNFLTLNGGTGAATVTVTGDGANTISAFTAASSVTVDAAAATGKQTYTLAGLGLGDVVKGGTGTADKISTTIDTAATSLPTLSGFETLNLNFTAVGTYNGSKTTDVTNLEFTPTANATVTELNAGVTTLTIGTSAAITATGTAAIAYVSGANSNVTLNVGATSASSDPAVSSTGAMTLTNNAGTLTVRSVGDAANTLGDITANKVTGLTATGVGQALTVGNLSATSAATVTVDGSTKNTTASTLTVDDSLTALNVTSGAGTATLGATTQTGTAGKSVSTTYNFEAGAKNLTVGNVSTVATNAAGTTENLNAIINVNATGAGTVTVGTLSFTGAGGTTTETTNVEMTAKATNITGTVTIAGLTVDEGTDQTSTSKVTLTGAGGAVTLTTLALTDSDTNTINLAADSSAVTITTLNNAISTKTDMVVTAASGQTATVGTLAGSGNINSITASGAGDISLFNAGTSAVTGNATIETTAATGNVTVKLGSAVGNLTVSLGNAASGKTNTVDTGGGADVINGGTGADVINGGAGADTINTGAGNDNITGGDGVDIMTGGAGADVFVQTYTDIDTTAGAVTDTITDFATGADTIKVGTAGGVATYSEAGATVADLATLLTAAGTALDGTVKIYVGQVTGSHAYAVLDDNGTGYTSVIQLTGVTLATVAATDFIV